MSPTDGKRRASTAAEQKAAAILDDPLTEKNLAKLLVGHSAPLKFEKASMAVARSVHRHPGESMRVAINQARDAERRARKLYLEEQCAKGEEKEALASLRAAHAVYRDGAFNKLADGLGRHAAIVALRIDQSMPRTEARECREALSAMHRILHEHKKEVNAAEVEHEKATAVLLQVTTEREVRLVRLVAEESVAAAGIIMRQRLQRSRVTSRVLYIAAVWRERARMAKVRAALREAVKRLHAAEHKAGSLEESLEDQARQTLNTLRSGQVDSTAGVEVLTRALRDSNKAKTKAEEEAVHAKVVAMEKTAEAEDAVKEQRMLEKMLEDALKNSRDANDELIKERGKTVQLEADALKAEETISNLEAEAEANQVLLEQALAQNRSGAPKMSASDAKAAKQNQIAALEMKRDVATAQKESAQLRAELQESKIELTAAHRELIEQTKLIDLMKDQLARAHNSASDAGAAAAAAEARAASLAAEQAAAAENRNSSPPTPRDATPPPPPPPPPPQQHQPSPSPPPPPPPEPVVATVGQTSVVVVEEVEEEAPPPPPPPPPKQKPPPQPRLPMPPPQPQYTDLANAPAADFDELKTLRTQVRLLRGQAARAEVLERDKLQSNALLRQVEGHLQSKSREVTNLSFALQASYLAAKERTTQTTNTPIQLGPFTKSRKVAPHKPPPPPPSVASRMASDASAGYELIQLIHDPSAAPPSALDDPVALLDGSAIPGAAMIASAAANAKRGQPMLVRMRNRVYALKEVPTKSAPLTVAELSERVHTYLRDHGDMPDPAAAWRSAMPDAFGQQRPPSAPAAARPPPRRPSRPSSANRKAMVARQAGESGRSSPDGGGRPISPTGSCRSWAVQSTTSALEAAAANAPSAEPNEIRPRSRPSSAQPPRVANSSPAFQAAPEGMNAVGRSLLSNKGAVLAAGLQQANTIKAKYGMQGGGVM